MVNHVRRRRGGDCARRRVQVRICDARTAKETRLSPVLGQPEPRGVGGMPRRFPLSQRGITHHRFRCSRHPACRVKSLSSMADFSTNHRYPVRIRKLSSRGGEQRGNANWRRKPAHALRPVWRVVCRIADQRGRAYPGWVSGRWAVSRVRWRRVRVGDGCILRVNTIGFSSLGAKLYYVVR